MFLQLSGSDINKDAVVQQLRGLPQIVDLISHFSQEASVVQEVLYFKHLLLILLGCTFNLVANKLLCLVCARRQMKQYNIRKHSKEFLYGHGMNITQI